MPRRTTGSIYRTATGYGIRWPEDGRRPHQAGFKTKTEARRWFADNVAPRLDRGAPSPEITVDAFCELFLERHGSTVSARTRKTLAERLKPARAAFGSWTLAEFEGAADDVARWRAGLTDTSRYRLTLALRQALGAAVRWRHMTRNPAIEAAGISRRGPYQLRHTFATEALAAGISIFELARVMGTSVKMIDRTYGHLACDSEEAIRARLDARADVLAM